MLKVTIITVSFNAEKTISDTINSVNSQNYPNIEHILIDGLSSDNTVSIIEQLSMKGATVISESDNGIYDAMNKGLKVATGDIIGFLNADDVFSRNDVISEIVDIISKENTIGVYGDVVFSAPFNRSKIVRYYRSLPLSIGNLRKGMMPAHPSLYLRKDLYDQVGGYSIDYKIASDFDFMVKVVCHTKGDINLSYLNYPLVNMSQGGVSTENWRSNVTLNREILDSLSHYNIKSNWFYILSKYPLKVWGVIMMKLRGNSQ